jgi:hypothetical protein
VDLPAWRRHFDAGLDALRADDPAAALEAFDAALALDNLHADTHFARGRALEARERDDDAREAYLSARDRDELRFRAPREINAVLREVAAEHGAHVVEVEEAFVRASPNGIVGRKHMLEHLHPNVEGYFVMGDAFYDALREHELIAPSVRAVPDEQARREMPVTEVDRLYGEYRIRRLMAGWPFSDGDGRYEPPAPVSREERIARDLFGGTHTWPDAMRRLLDHYRAANDYAEAAKVAVLLADAFPHRPEDQLTAARLLLRAGRDDFRVYERRVHDRQVAVAGDG